MLGKQDYQQNRHDNDQSSDHQSPEGRTRPHQRTIPLPIFHPPQCKYDGHCTDHDR